MAERPTAPLIRFGRMLGHCFQFTLLVVAQRQGTSCCHEVTSWLPIYHIPLILPNYFVKDH
jgi:hypothetical protein